MKKRMVGAVASLMTLAGVAGCRKTPSSVVPAEKKYTLRESISGAPKTWNTHTWETNGDSYVFGYTQMGFVDVAFNGNKNNPGYEFVMEMADSVTDVTNSVSAEFRTKWGLTDKDTKERVWRIALNKNAKWEDGTAIKADAYIASMSELLDHTMKNYRANSFYSGAFAIVGASLLYNSGESTLVLKSAAASITDAGGTVDSSKEIIQWGDLATLDKVSLDDLKEGGKYAKYMNCEDGTNCIKKYPDGTELTQAVIDDLLTTDWDFSPAEIDALRHYHATYPNATMNDVGLVKVDDYTLDIVYANPITRFNELINLDVQGNWLVDTALYDAGKSTTGNLTTTTYATSAETYKSFGPYKLVSYEKDKQLKFTKNENWYGWTDGKHNNQFMTTDIVCDIIKEHETAKLKFLSGELDSLGLEQADMAEYGASNYRQYTPETYTMRLVFDSNKSDLAKLEQTANNKKNKQILSNQNFRKAISLAIDRKRYNAEGTAGNEAAFALMNSLYYYDVENNPQSVYRNTDAAKKTIVKLYGIEYGPDKTYKTLDEAYKHVTGLDVSQAKQLFETAANEAIAAGLYMEGQEIEFDVGQYDATTTSNTAQIRLLNEFVAAATKGTKLEGKITFKGKSYSGTTSRYDAIMSGQLEMALCAWGGAAFYPFNMLSVYTDTDENKVNEIRSFNPKAEKLSVTAKFDGTTETTQEDTFFNWVKSLNAGGKYNDLDVEIKVEILAQIEYGLLNRYDYAIIGSYAAESLISMKIEFPVEEYNIMYGFGGLRFMTYKYTDAEWADFVRSQNGRLNYK